MSKFWGILIAFQLLPCFTVALSDSSEEICGKMRYPGNDEHALETCKLLQLQDGEDAVTTTPLQFRCKTSQSTTMTQFNITIPPDFIDKFVWPPSTDIAADGAAEPKNDLSSDPPALPQSYTFSDGIVSGVLGAAICAFSPASQLGGIELSELHSLNHDEDLPANPCLFTPYEGCHEIIDSVIQSVANQLNADVVVLDALELALGEFGVLGTDIGRAISDVYEPKPKFDSSRIQAAFDAIVTVSNKVQPCTGVDLTEASKRRFIYLRDFGSIARSAEPFMTRLLHAIRVRRSAVYENENHSGASGILHPTVLLMGFDKALTRKSCYCCWASPNGWSHSTFSEGGRALRKTLPALDSRSFYLEERRSEIPLKALSAAFFLPLVSKSSEVRTTALSLAQNSVIPALREECICLIPRNFQQNAVRDLTRRAEIQRKTDVQNTLIVLFLRQQGFLAVEDLNSAVSADTSSGGANPNNALRSDVLGDHPDIPLLIAVGRIATIAIGLAHQRPHAQTPIRIDAEDISKAHAIFIENSQTFSHWVDEIEGRRKPEVKEDTPDDGSSQSDTESSGAGEEERKDTIVEGVKNSRDLNKHEEKLLQCIVDCEDIDAQAEIDYQNDLANAEEDENLDDGAIEDYDSADGDYVA
ncbi:hypothetical protein GGX14DRAFT_662066 [Mycena pura]|uniref:Uncharacterized protein n=1 Tax=Mycena pura TaxID=153505 RepID=A0AAD6V4Q6_9AGAR|nr:hypothetical protein GGX14DRAFT_662066 [Mycena pura]